MTTNYPTTIDTYTTHSNGESIEASHVNNLQDAVSALETKIGIDNSAVTTALDYKIKSTSSIDPGHKHTLAGSISDVLISGLTDGEVLTYNLASSKWINSSTSAPDASTTVKGVTKMSVAPASASSPISVGDNDPRVPTQDENDALTGTSGTPSSTNKFVTNDDVSSAAGSGKIVRATGTALPALSGENLTKIQSIERFAGYTAASNTSENTVFTTTLAGGLLSTTGMIRITTPIVGGPDNNGSGNETYTLRLKYGGSTIQTSTISSIKGNGTSTYSGFVEFWIINNAATNSQNVGSYSSLALGGAMNTVVYMSYSNPADTTSAIDTTSSQTLALTVQRADGTNSSLAFRQGIIETIYK